jgi:hypothetical protein
MSDILQEFLRCWGVLPTGDLTVLLRFARLLCEEDIPYSSAYLLRHQPDIFESILREDRTRKARARRRSASH